MWWEEESSGTLLTKRTGEGAKLLMLLNCIIVQGKE